MRVTKFQKPVSSFYDLKPGDVFNLGGCLYMKMVSLEEKESFMEENAICLETGIQFHFGVSVQVTKVGGSFVEKPFGS